MAMGMFMGCGPRDSKSYPFESQFKRVVLHESTRSMYDKSWTQEVANSPLSLRRGKSRFEKMEKEEREKVPKEVTDREQGDGRKVRPAWCA